jgi:hypothetical protein
MKPSLVPSQPFALDVQNQRSEEQKVPAANRGERRRAALKKNSQGLTLPAQKKACGAHILQAALKCGK